MKSSALYRHIDRWFEQAWLFNLNQVLLDGGKARQIRRFLADVDYHSVIDIGCGTGNWATLSDGPYLGVDTSPAFIAACERRFADDPRKQFRHADASTLALETPYDLAQLISVLHHLSDEQVQRLTGWMIQHVQYLFILDLYPVPHNPISRFLYAMDRGDYIREPAEQKALVLAEPRLQLVKEADYFSPNRLYRHTMFLFAIDPAA